MLASVLVLALISPLLVSEAEERVATNHPHFVSQGGLRRVREGSDLELLCEVHDLGEFVLLWKFNRTTILFAGNLRIHRDERISRDEEKGSLVVRDFRLENVGEYSCQMSTNPPKDIVYSVSLLEAPQIRPQQQEIVVRLGESVSLLCDTSASVLWNRFERIISNERSLHLENVTKADEGLYTCTASNEMGNTSRDFRVRVLFSPQLSVRSKQIHAPFGSSVTIECHVLAEPAALVQWFRSDSSKVLPSRDFIIDRNETFSSLTIREVSLSLQDKYSCVANNSLGQADQAIHVTAKPSLPFFTSVPLGGKEKSYRLSWTLQSEPQIQKYLIEWRARDQREWKSAELIPSESEESTRFASYDVNDLEEDQSYEARVTAFNSFGYTASEVFSFVTSKSVVSRVSSLLLIIVLIVNKF